MSRSALYREYRPADLPDVVGQEHITRLLEASLAQQKLSHAYLFTGPRGTGKTSVARILARRVNELPAEAGLETELDIIEIDAASNRGIDEIRALREKIATAPTRLKYKVFIIDEPHRFSRDQKAFKVIVDEIKPQCIIRFGATFPETTSGRGKNKITVKDYQNLLYDLNACEAFNQNLIKGVTKEHFEPVSKREEKVKITSITTKDSVTFQYKKRDESTKTFTLKTGDSLSIINEAFEGITIHAIGKSTVEFSNGIQKSSG